MYSPAFTFKFIPRLIPCRAVSPKRLSGVTISTGCRFFAKATSWTPWPGRQRTTRIRALDPWRSLKVTRLPSTLFTLSKTVFARSTVRPYARPFWLQLEPRVLPIWNACISFGFTFWETRHCLDRQLRTAGIVITRFVHLSVLGLSAGEISRQSLPYQMRVHWLYSQFRICMKMRRVFA